MRSFGSEEFAVFAMFLCPAALGLAALGAAIFFFYQASGPKKESPALYIVLGVIASVFALGIGGCYATFFFGSLNLH